MDPGTLAATLARHRYAVLIPLSIVEGPIVAMATGALTSRGVFDPIAVYAIFVAKDVAMDSAFFWVGRWSRSSRRVRSILPNIRADGGHLENIRAQWGVHRWRSMVTAKLAWGLGPALLATAGFVGMPFVAFIGCAATVALVQYALLLALGYYIGSALSVASIVVRGVGYVAAAVTLIAIVALRRRWRVGAEEAVDRGRDGSRPVQHDDVVSIVDDDQFGTRNPR